MSEPKTDYAEPNYVQKQEKENCPFWRDTIADKTPPETHEFLETYVGLPREQHDDWIHQTRDRLWQIRQYPCTGAGGWLTAQLRLTSIYQEVLTRVKAGEIFVDIGAFIGHDLRRLAYDGAPTEHLWGVDIANHFDIGFDFFKDRERWDGKFVEADFLTIDTNTDLAPLRHKCDILWLASVIHQWDWAGQVRAVAALTHYTKPGSLVAGMQIGKDDAGDVWMQGLKVPLWVHSDESWRKLWDEVGAATATRWEVKTIPHPWEWINTDSSEMKWMGPGVRLFEFALRRVA